MAYWLGLGLGLGLGHKVRVPNPKPNQVHMAYWFDDTMHRVARRLRFGLGLGSG